jgi:nucleotide-binding universal stress UspA family protein
MEEKNRQNLVLIPTDFTEAADCAVNHAIEIAKKGKDELLLVHIVTPDTKTKLKKEGKTIAALEEQMQQQCDFIFKQHGVKAGFELPEGNIFTTIGETAKKRGARLLVMGTHGVVGLNQKVLGAWAVKVVTSSPVPVVIVQKKKPAAHGYKKIVMPMDASKEVKQKVFHAIVMAKIFDAEVKVYAKYESDEFIANQVKKNVGFAKSFLTKNNIKHSEEAGQKGNYVKELLRYSAQENADLLMIMTEKEEDVVIEFIIGPENEKIINNESQIPVMCVNPDLSYFKGGSILEGSILFQ